ncbi:hemerythrin domain-containing protein [Gordonia paraffinivorans]|uniref:hemerythrin domain-containing protein n=1 Tax=Gordonia paraffinivorans TaxID=175628 RepID=UPI001445C69F|nr:hemerythrin domain-containing protein [Gordonia paraffinivorans]
MTAISPAARELPDVNEMYVVHRVFRREFTALPALIRAVAAGDTARAAVVAEHLTLVLDGLHMHHTGEDEVLWPLLQVRAAPSTALVETMQHQHGVVDSRTEAIREHEAAWTQDPTPAGGERLAHLVEDLASALFEHLELEEREILPLVTCHIAVDEWRKLFEHGKDTMTPRQLPLMFGAVLEDADPDERARMLGQFPIPIALFLRTVGACQYRRYIRRVRAA